MGTLLLKLLLFLSLEVVLCDLLESQSYHLSLEQSLDEIYLLHYNQLNGIKESRDKRDSGYFPKIKRKQKKTRTCQNMAGIMGGSNAFNFINFVAAVVTLVVNINNNINNNNNNLVCRVLNFAKYLLAF